MKSINVPLLLIHAEEQLVSTQMLLLMAEDIIDLHKKISKEKFKRYFIDVFMGCYKSKNKV